MLHTWLTEKFKSLIGMFRPEKREKRHVACLFITRDSTNGGEVLLTTTDGVNWRFPGAEIAPGERPQETIKRVLCKTFDFNSTEEEEEATFPEFVYPETTKEGVSHNGVETHYRIFVTDVEHVKVADLKSNGMRYEWTKDPHSRTLNQCTSEMLHYYGMY